MTNLVKSNGISKGISARISENNTYIYFFYYFYDTNGKLNKSKFCKSKIRQDKNGNQYFITHKHKEYIKDYKVITWG